MTTSPERLRELGRLAPHIYDFLAADFNVDWDLDHLDAEAVYRNVLDGLLPSERTLYLFEAHLLRNALTDDENDTERRVVVDDCFIPLLRGVHLVPDEMRPVDLDELTARFPRFWTLIGGYFNDDWRDDYETAEGVYDDALRRMTRSKVEQLDAELESIAVDFPTGDDVERLLDALGTGLDPLLDTGRTPAQWLEDLRRYVRGDLGARTS
ncbi:contact-dependent growth inhibition system immunity protein [Curtobacterium sp. MCLR17_007]|uniref:contact-dependent growth inhibition system immunity protein n=1 Tax=Curtobacterium sp. MCLR17_007 TaxID=2175648 RepID=UPI000DA7E313|nr:contact-dependent growth inhibition system immunity protein [Curtobacterium sp. MCLR17_007]WIB60862.1 contact-dependent growth inhibition system immunity protein [Curtobacterium sp. MCLR17_007]